MYEASADTEYTGLGFSSKDSRMENKMKYRELYEKGKLELTKAGILEADLDARLLLEYVCGTNRNTLLAYPDKEVSAGDELRYEEVLQKRGKHIPLQHITGEQDFMGLTFKVNEHVLIPRQDTEILVEEAMQELHDGMCVLDMCTGSGCILLSLLKYSNDCTGVGVDISGEALKVAGANAKQLGFKEEQVRFIESDLFEQVEGKYDMIVSNPPYIPTDVIPTLMEEVKEHDPYIALDGKADGLYFYRKIAREAGRYLWRGGRIFLEIGHDQGEAVSKLLSEQSFGEIQVIKDYAGMDRVVSAVLFGNHNEAE